MPHLIYVAGPIMAPNPDREDGLVTELLLKKRRNKFGEVAEIIRRNVGSATTVINPLDIPACQYGTKEPMCSGVDNGPYGRGHTWQCYLRYDLQMLVMCDEVVMLEGWQDSPGATVEYQVACMLRLDISFWCNKHTSAHPEGPCK